MRTVNDIVGAVQERQPATENELRLALLCLYYDGQMAVKHDYDDASELKLRMRAKESFERRFRMLKSQPDKYLGDAWTPGTAENTDRRALSRSLAKAAGVLCLLLLAGCGGSSVPDVKSAFDGVPAALDNPEACKATLETTRGILSMLGGEFKKPGEVVLSLLDRVDSRDCEPVAHAVAYVRHLEMAAAHATLIAEYARSRGGEHADTTMDDETVERPDAPVGAAPADDTGSGGEGDVPGAQAPGGAVAAPEAEQPGEEAPAGGTGGEAGTGAQAR